VSIPPNFEKVDKEKSHHRTPDYTPLMLTFSSLPFLAKKQTPQPTGHRVFQKRTHGFATFSQAFHLPNKRLY
jgi:hypothetical protein